MIISSDETATRALIERIEKLSLGETITLFNREGQPLAVVVGIRPNTPQSLSPVEWQERWEALAQEVGQAWQSEKSAIEIVSEMRR